MHWDPVELYPYLNKSDLLNILVSIAFLEMHSRYRSETVFKDIFMLPERGRTIVKDNNIEIIRPQHIEQPEAVALKEDADPVDMFYEIIRKKISRWPIDPEHVGAILSSGLDTTIITNFLKEKIAPRQLRSFGYSMIQEQRDGVKAMRMETVKKLNLDDYYPKVEENFNESYTLEAGKWWEGQTQTDFAEINLAKRAATLGIDLVFSGIGGDELCMLTDKERSALKLKEPQPTEAWKGDTYNSFSLISEKYKSQSPVYDEFAWPDGYVGISSPDMACSVGLLFLRQGIWSANPLGQAELHMFTGFLPAEWRRKRRLSREALTRLGWSDNFIKQIPKENFNYTMDDIMLNVDWKKIFNNSILCNLGLIDKNKLFEAVDIFKSKKSITVDIKLVIALHLELTLQSVYKTQNLEKAA